MTSGRYKFLLFLAPILLSVTILNSWGYLSQKPPASAESLAVSQTFGSGLEELVFSVQSKVAYGALVYRESHAQTLESQGLKVPELKLRFSEMFKRAALDSALALPVSNDKAPQDTEPDKARSLERRIIICHALGLESSVAPLIKSLAELKGRTELDKQLDGMILSSLGKQLSKPEAPAGKSTRLNENDLEILEAHLGWFGRLQVYLAPSDTAIEKLLEPQVKGEALTAFVKFVVASFLALCVATVGGISLLAFGIAWFRGKFQKRFHQTGAPRAYALQIFVVYLLTMLLASFSMYFFDKLGIAKDQLKMNAALISCMPLVALFPLFSGVTLKEVRELIGFKTNGGSQFFKDLVIAPFVYSAALLVLFLVLMIYAQILAALHVNISNGAHPIVPLILGDSNKQTAFWVVLLAVFIAPFVEEIMFRGALYGWLREYLKPSYAIPVSALTFAVVHPQGPIGIVPLMFIGMVLATLREWRGTLTTCMLTHGLFNAGTLSLVYLFFK